MRLCYRRGGKDTAPEGFDRVYTEVDGSGSILRELLAYVRAGDSVTVEMGGELGGAAGAFTEMALALYQRQATLLCKSPKERFVVPRGVQDVIPIKAIYDDGIFQVGRDKFSKTYKFSDINYAVASREDMK